MSKKNLALIGMPSSGKTTIGKLVAKKLNLPFYDTDEMIEKNNNMSITDIFKIGEEYFRILEGQVVMGVSSKFPAVISTGGGVIKNINNINLLKKNGIIIFLDMPIKKIIENIDITKRPLLLKGENEIYKLYAERLPLYKSCSDIIINNDEGIDEAVCKIIDIYNKI